MTRDARQRFPETGDRLLPPAAPGQKNAQVVVGIGGKGVELHRLLKELEGLLILADVEACLADGR